MRALVPATADPVNVHDHYAAGWLTSGGIRANFVASVDGAASTAGRSRGLQTRGDNLVFAPSGIWPTSCSSELARPAPRAIAPATLSPARQEVRRSYGLAPTLPIAVVSRLALLDPALGAVPNPRPGHPDHCDYLRYCRRHRPACVRSRGGRGAVRGGDRWTSPRCGPRSWHAV
jgi:hypothetical protein